MRRSIDHQPSSAADRPARPALAAAGLATLTRVREETPGLPADNRVASAYARVHGAEVWAQDADFGGFAGVDVVRV